MSTAQPARESFFSAPFRAGVRDAIGVPAAVLAAGMIGFGAFALEHGLSLGLALACTVGIWALPGQIVLLEMHAGGASGLLTVLAVALTSARFLPMAMTLMPLVRHPRYSRDYPRHLQQPTSFATTDVIRNNRRHSREGGNPSGEGNGLPPAGMTTTVLHFSHCLRGHRESPADPRASCRSPVPRS